MCIVIIGFKVVKDYPLVLGVNRDELYERGGEPPALRFGRPVIFCGRDPKAGGTWMGLNQHGLLVAITDRAGDYIAKERRSRGLLCLDALQQSKPKEVTKFLRTELKKRVYNPFNLFYGNTEDALLVSYEEGEHSVKKLDTGVHYLANGDLNDQENPKLRRAKSLLEQSALGTIGEAIESLKSVLTDHGDEENSPICEHGEDTGTLSSTIVALGRRNIFLHADTAPCGSRYQDLSEWIEDFAQKNSNR